MFGISYVTFVFCIMYYSLTLVSFIIIIIIINEEIIVAFSPRTTRTRYKVKNKTARYVVSSSIEKSS